MFSSEDETELHARVERALRQKGAVTERYIEFEDRYENRFDVQFLSVRAESQEFRKISATINWCRLAVESIANRMSIAGFLTSLDEERDIDLTTGEPVGDSVDELLWDWWQAADMDKESRLTNTEALLQGSGYVIVNWPVDEAGKPAKYPEFIMATPNEMYAVYDPRTRDIVEAYQWWVSDPLAAETRFDRGSVYTKNEIIPIRRDGEQWTVDGEREVEVHGLNFVPVAHVVNRARLTDHAGRSEITDLCDIQDFATRLLTNTQFAQEFLAVPLRHVAGISAEDFMSSDGGSSSVWHAYMSSLLATENPDAKFGQLGGADLRNFTEVFNMLARQAAAVSSLPPHALGLSTSNPASADAIRSGESNLVQRIQDRSASFEQGWERAMKIALLWHDNLEGSGVADPDRARRMRIETTWNNPETPTTSAKADAVTKLRQSKIISGRQALEDMGYAPEKIKRILHELADERAAEMAFDWEAGLNDDEAVPPPVDAVGQDSAETAREIYQEVRSGG